MAPESFACISQARTAKHPARIYAIIERRERTDRNCYYSQCIQPATCSGGQGTEWSLDGLDGDTFSLFLVAQSKSSDKILLSLC